MAYSDWSKIPPSEIAKMVAAQASWDKKTKKQKDNQLPPYVTDFIKCNNPIHIHKK